MHDDNLANDLLFGAKAIADYLGLKERQVYHLASTNAIPVFRCGAVLGGRKSELNERFSAAKTEAE